MATYGGIADRLAEITKLLFHQQTRARLGKEPHDRINRCMRAMRGPKRVVHVHVGNRGELLGKALVVLLFLGVEAEILEEHDAVGGS